MPNRLPPPLVVVVVVALAVAAPGCGTQPPGTNPVWAVNVGGPAYDGVDGTQYEAEAFVSGGSTASLRRVKGSQDPELYLLWQLADKMNRPVVELMEVMPAEEFNGWRAYGRMRREAQR